MSTNKHLANQLTEIRLRAKQAADMAPVPQSDPLPVTATAQEFKPEEPTPPKKLKGITSPKGPTGRSRREQRPKNTTSNLERTTITLKSGDNAALSDLQDFLMKRARKAASTSTLIRLALFYTKQALSSDAEALTKAYHQILEEDGRRKVANV